MSVFYSRFYSEWVGTWYLVQLLYQVFLVLTPFSSTHPDVVAVNTKRRPQNCHKDTFVSCQGSTRTPSITVVTVNIDQHLDITYLWFCYDLILENPSFIPLLPIMLWLKWMVLRKPKFKWAGLSNRNGWEQDKTNFSLSMWASIVSQGHWYSNIYSHHHHQSIVKRFCLVCFYFQFNKKKKKKRGDIFKFKT